MTDRLLLLLLVVGGVLIGGAIARRLAHRRQRSAIEHVVLTPDESGVARILTFYGPSCDACDRQKLVLAEIEAERPGQIAIDLRDASREYDYARQFGLVIVPTTVVIRPNGSIAGIESGLASRQTLEALLDAA